MRYWEANIEISLLRAVWEKSAICSNFGKIATVTVETTTVACWSYFLANRLKDENVPLLALAQRSEGAAAAIEQLGRFFALFCSSLIRVLHHQYPPADDLDCGEENGVGLKKILRFSSDSYLVNKFEWSTKIAHLWMCMIKSIVDLS